MKKGLLYLVVLAFSSTMVNAQVITKTIDVVKTDVAPEIDGTVDDAWNAAADVAISSWGKEEDGETDKPTPDVDDFSASFKMMWDDEFVYLLGITVDDVLNTSEMCTANATPDWETDNWEVYWAPTNTQLEDMSEMTQVRFSYANAANEDASAGVANGWSEGGFTLGDFVSAARVDTDNGWVLEAKFDLAELAIAAEVEAFVEGDTLGFNINACDNDDEAARKNIGAVAPDAEWNQADTLPQIRLVAAGSTAIKNNVSVSNVSIYPNPTNGEFNVTSDVNVNTIEVINTIGATVYVNKNFNATADLSSLCNGIYMVKMYSNNNLVGIEKLIIK